MGFDVSGRKPTSDTGNYFRNNVWWWRPLWRYCCSVSPEAAAVKYGHSNDGDGVKTAAKAKRLADKLFECLANGHTEQYAKDYQAQLDAIPDEPCQYCGATGVRTDAVGVSHKMPDRVIDDPAHPRHGQTGWCNGCDGRGNVRPFETNYPFSVDNVREFAEFVRDSGGFEIW